jgi:peroxiredoxin Q/BCP
MTRPDPQQAPQIDITLSDGSRFNPARPGRRTLIYFYPRDDTPGCTIQAKDFTTLADRFAQAGVRVVGVSRDPMARHERFIAKHGLTVPLASDEDGRLSDAFGTWGPKTFMGRAFDGMERASFLIDADGRIERSWRKVRAKGHAEEVLAVVQGDGAGR